MQYGLFPETCLLDREDTRHMVCFIFIYEKIIGTVTTFNFFISHNCLTMITVDRRNLAVLRRKSDRTPGHSVLCASEERQPSVVLAPLPPLHHDDGNLGVPQVRSFRQCHLYRILQLSRPRLHVYLLRAGRARTTRGQIFDVEEIHDIIPIGKLMAVVVFCLH